MLIKYFENQNLTIIKIKYRSKICICRDRLQTQILIGKCRR